jgi:hypothetical protein
MIPDGRRFAGPVELINHHSQYLDGFLTKPKIPCARPEGTVPMAWPGVSMLELEHFLLKEAEEQKKHNKVYTTVLIFLFILWNFKVDFSSLNAF